MARINWLAGTVIMLMAARAGAAEPAANTINMSAPTPAEARIAFASRNIWNWHVVDDQTMLIQSNSRKWYKAKLLGNCPGLRFVERVGFKSNADDSFDKFSAIEVKGGHTCQLVSLAESDGPPPKDKKAPSAAAEGAKP